MAEIKILPSADVANDQLSYYSFMTRIFVSDSNYDELSALCLMLQDLKMEIVGESSDWFLTLAEVKNSKADLLLIDWNLLPGEPREAFTVIRKACPDSLVVVLIDHLNPSEEAALYSGADAFISKSETPYRTAERLRRVAKGHFSRLFHSKGRSDSKNLASKLNGEKFRKELQKNMPINKLGNKEGSQYGNINLQNKFRSSFE
jgi:DNA-binding NarL/FixJ family response regulator